MVIDMNEYGASPTDAAEGTDAGSAFFQTEKPEEELKNLAKKREKNATVNVAVSKRLSEALKRAGRKAKITVDLAEGDDCSARMVFSENGKPADLSELSADERLAILGALSDASATLFAKWFCKTPDGKPVL